MSTSSVDELLQEFQQYRIDYRSLVKGDKLGAGGQGSVFESVIPSLSTDGEQPPPRPVAVKKMRDPIDGTNIDRFLTNFRVSHRNVVEILGFCQQPYCLVMELCECSLHALLHGQHMVSFSEFKRWSLDIARGMEYLHANLITHRDLKPHNVLLTDNRVIAKICDLDLCKERSEFSDMTSRVGTSIYIAPEVIMKSSYKNEIRLRFPMGTPPAIRWTMVNCFHLDASKKPLFKEIIRIFTECDFEETKWIQMKAWCSQNDDRQYYHSYSKDENDSFELSLKLSQHMTAKMKQYFLDVKNTVDHYMASKMVTLFMKIEMLDQLSRPLVQIKKDECVLHNDPLLEDLRPSLQIAEDSISELKLHITNALTASPMCTATRDYIIRSLPHIPVSMQEEALRLLVRILYAANNDLELRRSISPWIQQLLVESNDTYVLKTCCKLVDMFHLATDRIDQAARISRIGQYTNTGDMRHFEQHIEIVKHCLSNSILHPIMWDSIDMRSRLQDSIFALILKRRSEYDNDQNRIAWHCFTALSREGFCWKWRSVLCHLNAVDSEFYERWEQTIKEHRDQLSEGYDWPETLFINLIWECVGFWHLSQRLSYDAVLNEMTIPTWDTVPPSHDGPLCARLVRAILAWNLFEDMRVPTRPMAEWLSEYRKCDQEVWKLLVVWRFANWLVAHTEDEYSKLRLSIQDMTVLQSLCQENSTPGTVRYYLQIALTRLTAANLRYSNNAPVNVGDQKNDNELDDDSDSNIVSSTDMNRVCQ